MLFPRRSFRAWLLGNVWLFSASAAAWAADPATEAPGATPPPDTLTDIVVTASRRAERAIRVPYDITAISGDDIANQHITQPNDLLREVPGISVVDRGPRNGGQVDDTRVRGIGVDAPADGDYALQTVSPVSTYINDTPVFANLLLKDISRVEVLRGPQATLYGSGSLGGTIKYIQNEPSTDAFSATVTSTQSYTANSDGADWDGDVTVNVPILDTLAARVTVSRVQDAGFIDYVNLYNLKPNGFPPTLEGPTPLPSQFHRENSANDDRTWYVHGALAWTPTEDLKLVFSYNYQNDHTGGRQAISDQTDGFGVPYGRYDNGAVIKEPSARALNIESLEATYDLGFATLTSSSSYYDHRGSSITDDTGFTSHTYLPSFPRYGFLYYSLLPAPNNLPYVVFPNAYSDRSWVEEVRLASDSASDNLFDYVVGFYFQDQNRGQQSFNVFPGVLETYNANPIYGPGVVSSDTSFAYNRAEHFQERAGFGEVTWHIAPWLDLTGGLRYFSNQYDVNVYIAGNLLTANYAPHATPASISEAKPLGKANLSLLLDDNNLLYAQFSQGYRRGGTNGVPTTGPQRENAYYESYKSDRTNNYEIGAKGILDGDLHYETALYWIDWSNVQLNTATPGFGYFAVINGQAAVSRGLEAQLSGHITPEVHFSVGYSYTNAFVSKQLSGPPAYYSTFPFVLAPEGTPLPAVPAHQANWSVDHTLAVTDEIHLVSRVTGTYQSESNNSVTPGTQFVGLDAFMLWNASETLTYHDYTASIFVNNVFNAKGTQSIFTNAYAGPNTYGNFYGSNSRYSIVTPLTAGLTLSYKF